MALFDTMFAYSGAYTVESDRVVHHVDLSWNEAWSGTDQVGTVKANKYRPFSTPNPPDRVDDSCAKTAELCPALRREQAV
jgi:Lipocalin-like domain